MLLWKWELLSKFERGSQKLSWEVLGSSGIQRSGSGWIIAISNGTGLATAAAANVMLHLSQCPGLVLIPTLPASPVTTGVIVSDSGCTGGFWEGLPLIGEYRETISARSLSLNLVSLTKSRGQELMQ